MHPVAANDTSAFGVRLYFEANKLGPWGLGTLKNLILQTLSGSFNQEQALIYLLVPLCFQISAMRHRSENLQNVQSGEDAGCRARVVVVGGGSDY